jgi:hypothetical protein
MNVSCDDHHAVANGPNGLASRRGASEHGPHYSAEPLRFRLSLQYPMTPPSAAGSRATQ